MNVEEIRSEIRKKYITQTHFLTKEGWNIIQIDINYILKFFENLNIKLNYKIEAFLYHYRGSSHSKVYAIPTNDVLTLSKNLDEDFENEIIKPEFALNNFMEAFDGDGSLWSYFQASILYRELKEYGALGHGKRWGHHRVLGIKELSHESSNTVFEEINVELFQWLEKIPKSFKPKISMIGETVEVEFYSHSKFDLEKVVAHRDIYAINKYVPSTHQRKIAIGSLGFKH